MDESANFKGINQKRSLFINIDRLDFSFYKIAELQSQFFTTLSIKGRDLNISISL